MTFYAPSAKFLFILNSVVIALWPKGAQNIITYTITAIQHIISFFNACFVFTVSNPGSATDIPPNSESIKN